MFVPEISINFSAESKAPSSSLMFEQTCGNTGLPLLKYGRTVSPKLHLQSQTDSHSKFLHRGEWTTSFGMAKFAKVFHKTMLSPSVCFLPISILNSSKPP
jgi:hypothetical protein